MKKTNVLIVGMGPASLFAVKTILEKNSNATVLVLEQGMPAGDRKCPADTGTCQSCEHCAVISGAGGAGMFSDGKLVLDLNFGGDSRNIETLSSISKKTLCNVIKETLQKYDGVSEYNDLKDPHEIETIQSKLTERNLQVRFYPVLHMGTKNLNNITTNFVKDLKHRYPDRLTILYGNEVKSIQSLTAGYLVQAQHGQDYTAEYVVTAVGKNGADWNKKALQPLGCHFVSNRAYYGVRVEVPAEVMAPLLRRTFDPKIFRIHQDGSKMKIHCVCKEGNVRMYRYGDNAMVGGHSPYTEANTNITRQPKSNFNVLLSCDKNQVNLSAMLQEFRNIAPLKILVQSYRDFKNNTITDRTAVSDQQTMQGENIRRIFDKYGDFTDKFLQFMRDLTCICPDLKEENITLYGPAMEWTMDRIILADSFETECPNIFSIGDGAGISQGIVYAGATGILAAEEICRRLSSETKERVLSR